MSHDKKKRKSPYDQLSPLMQDQMNRFDDKRGLKDYTLSREIELSVDSPVRKTARTIPHLHYSPRRTATKKKRDWTSGYVFWTLFALVMAFIGFDYTRKLVASRSTPAMTQITEREYRSVASESPKTISDR